MAMDPRHHPFVFTFGLLGSIVSVMMFLAPLPTFIRVYKKKSTEGFQSIPYIVALLSASLWIYYAVLKSDYLLLSINSFGCLIETIYIILYIIYAPKKPKMLALKLLILMNIGGFVATIFLTNFFSQGKRRRTIVGWLCVALSTVVFAAPLSIMRLVISTKSVEFMPFFLSFSLTLSAIMWLLYGVLLEDWYITIPNILGFLLGIIQMIIYAIYKTGKKEIEQNPAESINRSAIVMLGSVITTNGDANEDQKQPNGVCIIESLNQVQPIN